MKNYLQPCNWLFSNYQPLIEQINQLEQQIENTHLKDYLIKDLDPYIIQEEIHKLKSEFDSKNKQVSQWYLFWKTVSPSIITSAFLLMIQRTIFAVTIFTMDVITGNLRDFDGNGKTKIAFYLILITFCYIINTYLDSKVKYFMNFYMAKIKIVAQYLLYTKALNTKNFVENSQSANEVEEENEKQSESTKKENQYIGNLNTLMTADVDTLMFVCWALQEGLAAIILLVAAFWFLYSKTGSVIFQIILIVIGAQIFNLFFSFIIQYYERKELEAKDQRVGLSTDVIEGIKQIKYLSWEETFSQKIMEIRKIEFKMLSISKVADGFLSIFWNSIGRIFLYFFLVQYIEDGHDLQDSNVFTLITVFSALTFPLGILPWSLNQIFQTRVSYKRIVDYLNLPEIDKSDIISLEYPKLSDNDQENVIVITDIDFTWASRNTKPVEVERKSIDFTKVYVGDQTTNALLDKSIEIKENFKLSLQNLYIKQNTLTFIIGRIGSGKTAFFNALLNELDKRKYNYDSTMSITMSMYESATRLKTIISNDKVLLRGSVAYVPQVSWVQNLSIRENITFGKDFDLEWYKQCISACELVKDLKSFPKKDFHILGPEGKNLSGGQKQRIALCRAIYQDCDIYLLDDCFSSLDFHVADHIFEKAIIELLIKRGKTVLLITSQFRFITKGKYSSENILYFENGSIIRNEQIIQNFILNENEKESKQEEEEIKRTQQLLHEEDPSQLNDQNEDLPLLQLVKQSSSKDQTEDALGTKNQENDDQEEEEREKGAINIDTVKSYFQSMNWIFLTLFVMCNILMQMSFSLVDFWLREQITPGDNTLNFINVWFGNDFKKTFGFLVTLSVIVTTMRSIFYVVCNLLSAWSIFDKLNKAVIYSRMKFYDKNNQGRIVNRLQNDTYMIDNELPWFFHVFLENLNEAIGLPIGIMILFPWFGIVLIIELYLFYVLQKQFRKSNRDLKRINSVNEGKLLGFLNESTGGLKTIRAFKKETFFLTEYGKKVKDVVISFTASNFCFCWLSVRLQLLSDLIFICVALIIGVVVAFELNVPYSSLAMALSYAVLSSSAFSELFRFIVGVEQRLISVERVKQYFSNPIENVNDLQQSSTKIILSHQEAEIFIGKEIKVSQYSLNPSDESTAIEFKNVCMTYQEITEQRDGHNLKFALKNINLKIKRGEKIAFVGRTGSGKTSILNVIFKLYDFQYGQLFIEGRDSDQMTLKELRTRLSVVPQFGFLYKATLQQNLDPEQIATKEKIQELYLSTGFKISGINSNSKTDVDQSQSANLDFQIKASGANLSNGEKQVINYLRIMIQQRQIVCLDEATSNMDPATDDALHESLFNYCEDKTLLVITHRLENIKRYDRIIVMEKGEIVEIGNYNELIKNRDGFFNKLIQSQV